jgi:hypothetical protein
MVDPLPAVTYSPRKTEKEEKGKRERKRKRTRISLN